MTTKTWTLTSTKGTRDAIGTKADAARAAEAMWEELQPAYGVTIESKSGSVAGGVGEDGIARDTDGKAL